MNLINRLIVNTFPLVPKPIVWQFSKKYIAGEKIEDAVLLARRLNAKGIMATIDVLGEDITLKEEAVQASETYVTLLDTIAEEKLDSHVSLKLTQFGLKIDKDLCLENVRKVIEKAEKLGNFVRIDMEDSTCTEETLDIFRKMRKDHENVGIVLQSYLRRTLDDVVSLADELKANIRLCKGAYIEPRDISYTDKGIIDGNFAFLIEEMLKRGCYVGVATHDEKLVWAAIRSAHELGLKKDQFEFQMLVGVDEELGDILVKEGYRVRIYIPFGEHWHPYCMRRLRENPVILTYVLKNLFS